MPTSLTKKGDRQKAQENLGKAIETFKGVRRRRLGGKGGEEAGGNILKIFFTVRK